MTVERRLRRIVWISFVLSFIPDSIIAYVVMRITEFGWTGFAITLLGLWGVYLAVWLKNSIWSWINFFLWGRRERTAFYLSALRAGQLPEPFEFEKSADHYFERTATDEKASVKSRLQATASLAEQRTLVHMGLAQAFIQTTMAMDGALEQYKNQFPPKAAANEGDNNADAAESVSDAESKVEAGVVTQVQLACQIAAMSAGYPDDEYERQRFEEYITKALALAEGIRDEFYQSAAFHQIVKALIKDKQIDRAQELACQITVDMISEEVEAELRQAQA